jgi:hypothetical protein
MSTDLSRSWAGQELAQRLQVSVERTTAATRVR